MAYENVIDPERPDVVKGHLHLGAFTRVNKEMPVLDYQVLRGGEPAIRRQRSAGAEDGKFEIIQGAKPVARFVAA